MLDASNLLRFNSQLVARNRQLGLSMAYGAACAFADLILFNQLAPYCELIRLQFFHQLFVRLHHEDEFARSDVLFRIAMAVQTPLHLESAVLPRKRHIIDAPVTSDAADSFFNVNAVIEIGEIGKVMDSVPFDRFAASETLAHRFEHRACVPDLRVTVHTSLRRRNPCKGGFFDRRMTVSAIQSQTAYMVTVAEGDGLLSGHICLSDVR